MIAANTEKTTEEEEEEQEEEERKEEKDSAEVNHTTTHRSSGIIYNIRQTTPIQQLLLCYLIHSCSLPYVIYSLIFDFIDVFTNNSVYLV